MSSRYHWEVSEVDATRPDAWAKATGAALYSGDLDTEGVLHAALVTSPVPSALIKAVELDEARTMPGVVAALGAADLPTGLFGRRVRDMPLLARERVRFAGERVAVVLALSRRQARRAAARVDLVLEPTPAVLTPTQRPCPASKPLELPGGGGHSRPPPQPPVRSRRGRSRRRSQRAQEL